VLRVPNKSGHVAPLFLVLALLGSGVNAQVVSLHADIPRCVEPQFKNPGNMVQPKYPKDALRSRIDGTVELRILVTSEGQTKTPTVVRGDGEFARASLDAVRKWRFFPASLGGRATETTYKVHVHFNSLLLEAVTDFELESPRPEPSHPSETVQTVAGSEGPIYRPSDPGVVAPRPVHTVIPEFTEQAREAKENGLVTLSLIVGTNGEPGNIKVVCSSVPNLNQQAIESVKLWRFEPGTKDGEPVPVRMAVDTTFRLH
jgi:TonB family protein